MTRRRVLQLVGVGAPCLLLAACGGSTTVGSPSTGGATTASGASGSSVAANGTTPAATITMAMDGIGANLDPYAAGGTVAAILNACAFEALTAFDATGTLIPSLATAWTNVDPQTWEFTLRSGVKFAAGQPFDADAVKFNVDRLLSQDGQASPIANNLVSISGIQVVSPSVVRITTKQPDPLLPARVAGFWMVGPEYPAKPGSAPFNAQTNGTGPYQSVSYKAADTYELAFNPAAWRIQGKDVSVGHVKLVAIPEAAARVAALKNHEVDIIFSVTPSDQLATLGGQDLQVVKTKSNTVTVIRIDSVHGDAGNPLQKTEVRQALEFAINRDAVNQAAYSNFGTPLGEIAGDSAFGYNPTIAARPFDLDKAKQLLAQAGFSSGFSLPITVISGEKGYALALQGMWQELGVSLSVNPVELGTYTQMGSAGTLGPLAIQGVLWPFFDTDSVLNPLSDQVRAPQQIWNNPQFNSLYTQSTRELEPTKRQQLLQQALALVQQEAAEIPILQREFVYGADAAVNFTPRSDGLMFFDTITKKAS